MFNDFSDGYLAPWAEQGGQPQPPFHIIDEDSGDPEAITPDDPLDLADPVTRNKKPALSIIEMENTEPSDDQPDYEEDGNASEAADIDGDLSYAEAPYDPFSMYCAKLQGQKQKFLDRQEVYELSEEGKQHRTDMIEALLSIPYTRRRIIAAYQKTAKITAKLSTHIAVRYTGKTYDHQNKNHNKELRRKFRSIAVRLGQQHRSKGSDYRAFSEEITRFSMRRPFWKKLITKAQANIATMPAADQDQLKKAARAFTEDTRCRNKLALNFQRFTLKVTKQFFNRPVPRMDLFQQGFIGLLKLYDRWDHTRGVGFMTFAAPNIRQSIQLSIARTERLSRMHSSRDRGICAIVAFTASFVDEHARHPTDAEIAKNVRLGVKTVKTLRQVAHIARLDNMIGEDLDTPLSAFVPCERQSPADQVEQKNTKIVLREAVASLSAREARLLQLRYFEHGKKGNGQTLDEISKVLDKKPMTRERVRQIEVLAFNELRGNPKLLGLNFDG